MNRLISSVNVNYNINQSWMLNGAFSNFNSESQMTLVNTLDTMMYAQVTQNANAQLMYSKATKKIRIASAISGNYQNAKINGIDNSILYNGNLSTQLGFLKSGLNITIGVNTSTNITDSYELTTIGPSIVFAKRFLNGKIMTSISNVVMSTYLDNVSDGYILNSKVSTAYRVNRHHSFNFNFSLIKKESTVTDTQETLTTLGYNFTF